MSADERTNFVKCASTAINNDDDIAIETRITNGDVILISHMQQVYCRWFVGGINAVYCYRKIICY